MLKNKRYPNVYAVQPRKGAYRTLEEWLRTYLQELAQRGQITRVKTEHALTKIGRQMEGKQ